MKPMDIMEIKKKLCTFFFLATHSEEKHCKPHKIKTQQKPKKIDHDNNPKRKIEKLGIRKHHVITNGLSWLMIYNFKYHFTIFILF